MVGKRREVELVLVALSCRGHVLIEDVPGVGKTVLAKAIARSIGASFKRVQFTPDLLPGNVTGVSVFDPQHVQFESGRGRSSRNWSSPTRSTGPRRKPSPALRRRWKSLR